MPESIACTSAAATASGPRSGPSTARSRPDGRPEDNPEDQLIGRVRFGGIRCFPSVITRGQDRPPQARTSSTRVNDSMADGPNMPGA